MTLLYNPNFTSQKIRAGAVTGINYSFFPNKPTEVKDEDGPAFLLQGFEIWDPPKPKKKKSKTH